MSTLIVERETEIDLVTIGHIVKTQGRDGEVVAEPASGAPGRFHGLARLFVAAEPEPVAYDIERVRLHKGRPVLKLAGVGTIDAGRALTSRALLLPAEELAAAEEDVFFHFEIVGARVIVAGQSFAGRVVDVLDTGGTDVLVVESPDGRELLLPLCSEICRRIDPEGGVIEIDPPEGLLEINAR